MKMHLDDVVGLIVRGVAGPLGTHIVRLLLNRQDETLNLLRSLNEEVQDLINGPFNTGLAYLRESQLPGRSAGDSRESLILARQEFMRALGQQRNAVKQAEVALYLSATWLALDKMLEAREYAMSATVAYQEGIAAFCSEKNAAIAKKVDLRTANGVLRYIAREEPTVTGFQELEQLCLRLDEANHYAHRLGAESRVLVRLTPGQDYGHVSPPRSSSLGFAWEYYTSKLRAPKLVAQENAFDPQQARLRG